MAYNEVNVLEFEGKTILRILQNGNEDASTFIGGDTLYFEMTDGTAYLMYHSQDCCEHVSIEDIIGDLDDLIGEPLFMAEEVSEDASTNEDYGSATWTFYKFATIKGYVTIRWYGSSNGYYSESVQIDRIDTEKEDTL